MTIHDCTQWAKITKKKFITTQNYSKNINFISETKTIEKTDGKVNRKSKPKPMPLALTSLRGENPLCESRSKYSFLAKLFLGQLCLCYGNGYLYLMSLIIDKSRNNLRDYEWQRSSNVVLFVVNDNKDIMNDKTDVVNVVHLLLRDIVNDACKMMSPIN